MPGLSSKRVTLSSSLGPGLQGEVVQVLRVVVEPKPGVKLRVVPQYELEVLWKVSLGQHSLQEQLYAFYLSLISPQESTFVDILVPNDLFNLSNGLSVFNNSL